jgi:GT2 family glycosyltransferase
MNGISIVMAYHNRRIQLIKTLNSINKTNYDKSKLEIIIINDCSSDEHNINDLPIVFNKLNIKLLNTNKISKDWVNSCVPYNMGFNYVKYDKIIIQNPECYHNDDILSYTYDNLTNKNYLSFGCYSLNNEESNSITFDHIKPLDQKFGLACSSGWYNHTEYRPSYYHFCSAITKNNLDKLNGFDEDFKDGIGWDDNEFLYRIKLLDLSTEIINEPFVYHQAHNSNIYRYNELTPQKEKDYKNNLFYKNNDIYKNKTLKLLNYKILNNKYYK